MKKAEKYYIRIHGKPTEGSNIPIKIADFIFYKKGGKYHVIYIKYNEDYVEYLMHGLIISGLINNDEISEAFEKSGYNISDIQGIIIRLEKLENEKKKKFIWRIKNG